MSVFEDIKRMADGIERLNLNIEALLAAYQIRVPPRERPDEPVEDLGGIFTYDPVKQAAREGKAQQIFTQGHATSFAEAYEQVRAQERQEQK